MSKKRIDTTTMSFYDGEVITSWGDSTLILKECGINRDKKVVIKIERPSDIALIRGLLSDIEMSWRNELDTLKQ